MELNIETFDYHSIGSDLYPGEEYDLFINRKLEYDGDE